LPLGLQAPDFTLLDTISDDHLSLSELKGLRGTLIAFICNHCPYVIHINEGFVQLANDYIPKGISFIAISSNDVEKYSQDGPDHMKQVAKNLKYPFPYLYDQTQTVAKSYDAACTPDFYLFDDQLKLVYRGRLDNSRPGNNIPVTGNDLRTALDLLIKGDPISEIQYPSAGCNIKWK
jgi:peroxiredoxin